MKMDEKTSQKNSRVDLCYLASIWAPNADEEALRMMLDWNHWVSRSSSRLVSNLLLSFGM
jgi:hypothetical protein